MIPKVVCNIGIFVQFIHQLKVRVVIYLIDEYFLIGTVLALLVQLDQTRPVRYLVLVYLCFCLLLCFLIISYVEECFIIFVIFNSFWVLAHLGFVLRLSTLFRARSFLFWFSVLMSCNKLWHIRNGRRFHLINF